MKIIKRNGTEVVFDIDKIRVAITKANEASEEKVRMTPLQIDRIAENVRISCENMGRSPSVEEIQDLVEKSIMAHGAFEVAKSYITYRYTRSLLRQSNTTDDRILTLIESNNEEVKQENANKNPTINAAVSEWICLAKQGDHRALMESNLRLIYSDKYYRNNAWLIPAIGAITKPKSYERFFRQAEACLSHDSCSQLPRIKAPTLIIGGEKYKTVGGEASRELHQGIANSVLRMYPNGYHGLYEEEKDFNFLVLNFLKYKN